MEIYDPRYCADLGDGYMVKWADEVEARSYGHLCDVVFRRSADAPIRNLNAMQVIDWTDAHPTTSHTDIAVVVDAQSASQRNLSGVRPLNAGEDFQKTRLAAAIASHQSRFLSRRNG